MNKIYISGCGGMLGEAFYSCFSKDYELCCSDIEDKEDWLHTCDIRNLEDYREDVRVFTPDCLIHLAAQTDLEKCEEDYESAYASNVTGTKNAVIIAGENDIPIVYISTASIFDGKKACYEESDTPNPMGAYARTKYLGERFIIQNSSRYLICRAGWMMGGGAQKDKKFVNKIIEQILHGKKTLHIVNDKMGSLTYTCDLAGNIELLIRKKVFGIFNMVCNGFTDRVGLAREILAHFGLTASIEIKEVTSSHFSETYVAPRSPSACLMNVQLDELDLNRMQDWRTALHEYLATDFAFVRNRI